MRRGIYALCNVQHGAPVTLDAAIGALLESSPDLAVETVALPCLHRDVAGERDKQAQILVGVVAHLPVEVANEDEFRQAVAFDLLLIVGQFTRAQGPASTGAIIACWPWQQGGVVQTR